MRIWIWGVALLAGLLGACNFAGSDELTLEQLIDRHTAARGGAEAIEAMRSVTIDLEIVEPTFTVTGRYYATRAGLMRVDIFAGEERVFTEALGPEGAWNLPGGATVGNPISEFEANILLRGIHGNLYGLHELAGLGYQISQGDRETVDGAQYYVINTTSPDGFDARFYIDPVSFQIVRSREHSALHPAIDDEQHPNETVISDFREVGGVTRSFHDEKYDLETGDLLQTTQVLNVQINVDVDPIVFTSPEG